MYGLSHVIATLLIYGLYSGLLTIAADDAYSTAASTASPDTSTLPGSPTGAYGRPARQGNCPWPLDPFFGVYDMVGALRHNIVNFTQQVLFTPAFLVDEGERQKFNTTDDGEMYIQWVHNGNNENFTAFDSRLSFVCGEEYQIHIPGPNVLNYSFTMVNETTLHGHFFRSFPDLHTADINFWFTFNETHFWDYVHVTSPIDLIAYAPFKKIDSCERNDCTFIDN